MSLQQMRNRLKRGYLCGQGGLLSSGTQDDGGGLPQVGTLGITTNFGTACQPCGLEQSEIRIDIIVVQLLREEEGSTVKLLKGIGKKHHRIVEGRGGKGVSSVAMHSMALGSCCTSQDLCYDVRLT